MKNWLRDIRGAVAMGLLWAFAGALVALPIEAFIDPHGAIVDIWVGALAYPGFFGGVVFFTVLRIAEGRRRLDELSLPRAAAWGAVSGLLLPVLFALALAAGLGTVNGPIPWPQIAAVVGATTLGTAVAASVSVGLARWWKGRSQAA